MRMEQRDGEHTVKQIGAAVVRPERAGVVIELGPADGPPGLRLTLTMPEANRLIAALRGVLAGRDEEIILTEG